MIALTLTSVANVLVIMALGPLVTALFARAFSATGCRAGHGRPSSSPASVSPGCTRGRSAPACHSSARSSHWPFRSPARSTSPRCSTAQRRSANAAGHADPVDMLPTVFIGAVISAAATCRSPGRCRHQCTTSACSPCSGGATGDPLPAARSPEPRAVGPEIALLGLLEVVFGVTWTWLWAGNSLRPRR